MRVLQFAHCKVVSNACLAEYIVASYGVQVYALRAAKTSIMRRG